MRRTERSLSALPKTVLVLFCLTLFLQLWVHSQSKFQSVEAYSVLTKPFDASVYQAISMGSEKLVSYILAIRLQLHDNQAGRHLNYRRLDYPILVDWLERINQINLASEYPMLLASRVYSQTPDKRQLKLLLDYIDRTFLLNPQLHWRRQAEATVIAKHSLNDLDLALSMAQKLSMQPEEVIMPHWARDMHFLLLGDLNEFETAIVLIQGLLADPSINDNDERRFLNEKLLYFQQKLSDMKQKSEKS